MSFLLFVVRFFVVRKFSGFPLEVQSVRPGPVVLFFLFLPFWVMQGLIVSFEVPFLLDFDLLVQKRGKLGTETGVSYLNRKTPLDRNREM